VSAGKCAVWFGSPVGALDLEASAHLPYAIQTPLSVHVLHPRVWLAHPHSLQVYLDRSLNTANHSASVTSQ
jgi:hypothetical protein